MQTHTLLALSNPVEGREAEFNQWFDTVHIPEVLRVPGFASVQRFEAAAHQRIPGALPYRYLAQYELQTDDLERTLQMRAHTVQAGTKTQAGVKWSYSRRARALSLCVTQYSRAQPSARIALRSHSISARPTPLPRAAGSTNRSSR